MNHEGFGTCSQNYESRQECETLENVCGYIKLCGTPYYNLVFDDGTSCTSLVVVDLARHLVNWISSVGKKVLIKKLLVISDTFQAREENKSIQLINYVVKWEQVKLLEDDKIQSTDNFQKHQQILETKNESISFIKTEEAEEIIKSERTYHIIVHHVSIPFHATSRSAFGTCLVLISYNYRDCLENKLWLVLRAEQVAWRKFLIPNREYLLHLPQGTDKLYFDKNRKPLDTIMEHNIRELRVIFHHKIFFSKYSLLGSTVPKESKLYLSGNTNYSEYVYKFTADTLWFRFWFSTSESDHADVPLISFYGRIINIKYYKEDIFKSCYLCLRKQPNKPEVKTPKNEALQVWLDPFKRRLELGDRELVELPNVYDQGDRRMKTGVPGEMVQMIKLQDLVTGDERNVYIKHNYVKSCQQMARLAPGLTVCFTHLNRRCASNGKCYYITTMLTCCRVLDSLENRLSEEWGHYGICQKKENQQLKTWGVLEPFNVIKVAIRSKCSYCEFLFDKGKCSGYCGAEGVPAVSAYAVAWINVVHDDKTLTMEKVLIKEDLVRILLGIPEKFWQILRDASVEEEIVAFRDQDLDKSSGLSPLRQLFQTYFSVKPREKCYVSVKKLPQNEEGDLYYCINLEPINSERLNVFGQLVNKEINNKFN
ncbi:uncharacterized protein LOC128991912 [Macrosteles quadrilineatus]|uniref:uncharacterized protein LOC128991912 n=1 Tax=Macrosteles quadrilineatus TaxID=74068 RepID=UPI0023E2931B|nr:uncharacterized protein LOC128991912 [Macrosteles quadrilineatus]XP_054271167.1 uncharacterized protein LOC128991912 [Macrosteles quadrilineatus]XP_054271168.1 uncharacterized protein LOC128991912 [Macrosteles quadrilineatus]XP_054271169.1 uncharacterized protein LOC128991912 [Macrosteles quadrilineatus]